MSRSELQKELGLKGAVGRCLSNGVYDFLKLDGINNVQDANREYTGAEFASAALKTLGVTYDLDKSQLDRIPAQGGFIVVANHHFGSIDGLIMEAIFGSIRPDFKMLTTFLLSRVPGLTSCFIPVDNFSNGAARSLNGIRQAMAHISGGNGLGIFPAGEVATWQPRRNRTSVGKKRIVEDIPWQETVIKIIKRSGLPVIPVYFDGTNSRLFHRLGRIHPRLRTVMLTRETLNKQGYTVKVRIGQPILPEDVEGMDIGPLGRYLRSRSYALQSQCLSADSRVSHEWPSPVAEKVDPAVVRGEIDSLSSDKLLMEDGNYRLYLLHTVDAPNVMRDLYRLREETFRAVGEGTGKPFDTDKYDDYYYQLILWNVPAGEIAGAYRLGDCGAIIDKYGVEGIYSASLYRYKAAAEPVLRKCIELGRSFVARKYQREIHPLRLLLAGIAAATLHIPSAEYFLGPVSISNDYPVFFKSLATRFLERDFPLADAASLVEPTHPFVPDYMAVNPDDLLKVVPEGDIVKFDRLFSTISDGKYHLPVLVRQYFSCSARLACLNVDPDFTDSLDGLILLRLSEFPKAKTRSILRGAPEELREAINTHFFGND